MIIGQLSRAATTANGEAVFIRIRDARRKVETKLPSATSNSIGPAWDVFNFTWTWAGHGLLAGPFAIRCRFKKPPVHTPRLFLRGAARQTPNL